MVVRRRGLCSSREHRQLSCGAKMFEKYSKRDLTGGGVCAIIGTGISSDPDITGPSNRAGDATLLCVARLDARERIPERNSPRQSMTAPDVREVFLFPAPDACVRGGSNASTK